MDSRKIILTLFKILILLGFLAVFIIYAVKDYAQPFNGIRKSPVTIQNAAFLGILLTVWCFIIEPMVILTELRFKAMLKACAIVSIFACFTSAICYGLSDEIAAMGCCIAWIIPLVYSIYLAYREQRVSIATEHDANSIISQERINNFGNVEQAAIYDTETHKGRCKCCVLWSYFILLTTAVTIIAINGIAQAYNYKHYAVVGKLVEVKAYPKSDPNGQSLKLRVNCFGQANGKPTFLFEHGGGANGISFEAIQQLLGERGRRGCSYDRPGFGRSDMGPADSTPEEDAYRTMQLLQNIGESGPYIAVGWSAGVEIVQVLAYYFPTNISGLAFIDGYPNYRALQAIDKNLSDSYVDSARSSLIGILWIIRNLEPYGTGNIIGGTTNFHPQEMKDLYTAYYRNYYAWHGQYVAIKNPNDLTKWLTKLADDRGDAKPYPSFNLNWPNITVPLLIMPANKTISDSTTGSMYYQQCQKYQSKAVSATIDVLPGQHSIVYENPQAIVDRLLTAFP